jgi:tRNA(adenine34) deaminase
MRIFTFWRDQNSESLMSEGSPVTDHREQLMDLALDEARAALEHGDVPVGAIVVHNGVVIAARHNERELDDNPIAHAEMLALVDAATHLGQWRLNECTMYVTLEPCAMCAGALVNSRLGKLVYAAHDPKAGAVQSQYELLLGDRLNHRVEVTAGIRAQNSADLLRTFFRARRKTNSTGED